MMLALVFLLASDRMVVKNSDCYAGPLKLPWDAAHTVRSGQTFVVHLKNGVVESAAAERIVAIRDRITALRLPTERKRFELASAAKWSGSGDTGFSLARGKAETSTITAAVHATGVLALFGASIFSRAVSDGQWLTSANLQERSFGFVSADLDHNPVQGLNLRSVLGACLGQHVRADKQTTIDLFARRTYKREEFTSRRSARCGRNVTERSLDAGSHRMAVDSSSVTSVAICRIRHTVPHESWSKT